MDSEMLSGNVIMLFCNMICSIIFISISIWADIKKTPMHFYSGTSIEPWMVSDVSAYNKANAKMWLKFSLPFILSFICNIVAFFVPLFLAVGAVLISLDCTVGIAWLMITYQKIEKKFIIR